VVWRERYLEQLLDLAGKPLIKVITGLRRSGKSTLLILLKEALIQKGVPEKQIILLNFESFEHADIDNAVSLYQAVKSRIDSSGHYYILLDEIQEVSSWEKAVDAFTVDLDADIYITGSNSRLLSSELATYLAGRYIDIPLYTLSFGEFITFREALSPESTANHSAAFEMFLRKGGFPVIHTAFYSDDTAYRIIYDIYSSAILRDTVQRFSIRDIELLERVVKYVFDNIGHTFSAKNIADYFKSQQRKIDLNTVYNYLYALESAFIIYKVPRYDIKGREILKTLEKYYLGDQSMLYAVMGYKDRLIAGVLENIVMLELMRRGYRVFIGKSGNHEIDFVAEQRSGKIYIQVAYKLTEPATIEREYRPLLAIRDQYPKYVVTMDETWKDNIEGIRHYHIADFLLLKDY
jgi:predicted AAA+ superfamily ATPase